MADNGLITAVEAGLRAAIILGRTDIRNVAETVADTLTDHGVILPTGITIGAVYEVFRDGDRDGYEFTDRREADEQARFGGHDGRCGEVRTAWRIQADGVDTLTTWKSDPRKEQP